MASEIKDDLLDNMVASELQTELSSCHSQEQQEFFDWLCGKTQDPPSCVKGVIANLSYKINATMGYLATVNLSRMNRLADFLSDLEVDIFTEGQSNYLTFEQKLKLYEKAASVYDSSFDQARKYLQQNKDISLSTPETDSIKDLLLSMPHDKLVKLRRFLQENDDGT